MFKNAEKIPQQKKQLIMKYNRWVSAIGSLMSSCPNLYNYPSSLERKVIDSLVNEMSLLD